MREQAVAAAEIDDPASPQQPPHATGELPRFIQLFARQTAGAAHRAGDAMKECAVGKSIEIAIGQPAVRRMREPRRVGHVSLTSAYRDGTGSPAASAALTSRAWRHCPRYSNPGQVHVTSASTTTIS